MIGGRKLRLTKLLLQSSCSEERLRSRKSSRQRLIAKRSKRISPLPSLTDRRIQLVRRLSESLRIQIPDRLIIGELLLPREIGARQSNPISSERPLRDRIADDSILLNRIILLHVSARRIHNILDVRRHIGLNIARKILRISGCC